MNPSSIDTLKNNFFEIQNVNSSFNQYYHLTWLHFMQKIWESRLQN